MAHVQNARVTCGPVLKSGKHPVIWKGMDTITIKCDVPFQIWWYHADITRVGDYAAILFQLHYCVLMVSQHCWLGSWALLLVRLRSGWSWWFLLWLLDDIWDVEDVWDVLPKPLSWGLCCPHCLPPNAISWSHHESFLTVQNSIDGTPPPGDQ